MAWGKAGSSELTSSASEVEATISANKCNQILNHVITAGSGNIGTRYRFNDDSGSKYAQRYSHDGGADGTNVNQAQVFTEINDADEDRFQIGYMVSVSGKEKLGINFLIETASGAGSAPQRSETVFKYVPSPDATITSVKVLETVAGSFGSNTNLTVLGSDLTPAAAIPAIDNVQNNSLFVDRENARRYWFDNIFSKTGLKAYYNFNESSGNLINQSTTGDGLGSNADGTASGDPTYSVTGKVDNAISFDGDGDKFTLGTAAGQWNFLHNNSDFSISFWLKLNATPSEQQGIMGTGTGGSSIGFDLKAQLNNNGRLVASIENGAGATASITSSDNFIPQNTTTWYHYVLTFSNGSWNIYRNGGNNESASSSISWSTSNHSRNMEIANANANTPTDVKDLTGELDEVSIWNRVLTSDEISALYNSGSGVAVTDAKNPTWLREKSYISKLGCLIYYNFDQTSGNATNLATTANGFTDGLGSTGDGVNSGATTGQTGKIDYAWSFDGTNDQVDSGSSSDLILTGDMTWAAWVNINTTTSSKVITVASIRGDAGSNTEANNALFSFFIVQNSSPPTLRAFHENAGGTNNQVDFTTSLHEDRWYHIVFTRDVSEKTVKCYIDGSLHGSGTYSNNPTTTTSTLPLRTGGNNFSGAAASDGHFNGLLDEVSIWNRILTADEISALYNSGHGVVI